MSNKIPINVKQTIEVDEEFIESLMCDAFEGGSAYWATAQNVVRNDYDYVSYELRDAEDEDDEWHLINKETMTTALSKILSGEASLNSRMVAEIMQGCITGDSCHLDADHADCVVQIAAYGEVVFG